jgi:polyisoprenoid-binding protein YceI
VKFFVRRAWRIVETGAFMNRILQLVFVLIFCGLTLNAQTLANSGRDFTIDVSKSKVDFIIGSSEVDVCGTFQSSNGNLYIANPGVPQGAALKFEISAATLSTGSDLKDKIAKGKNYFNVRDFPTLSFDSTGVIPSSDPNKFQIQGNFAMRGITQPVVLQVNLDPDNGGTGRINANLYFDRRDFGVKKNSSPARGNNLVIVGLDLNVTPAPVISHEHYSWSRVVRINVSE